MKFENFVKALKIYLKTNKRIKGLGRLNYYLFEFNL